MRPSFCSQFLLTLAFKSIQITYSHKPLHPWSQISMQNNQTAGLQTGKIQPGQESKMATNTKISKTKKNQFFLPNGLVYLA